MSDQNSNQSSNTPTSISLSPTAALDLRFLSDAERKALLSDYTKGMLDLGKKATELNIDHQALRSSLDTLAQAASDVAKNGGSATISHVQETKNTRTEILIGNSDAARKGQLSKLWTGVQKGPR